MAETLRLTHATTPRLARCACTMPVWSRTHTSMQKAWTWMDMWLDVEPSSENTQQPK